MGGVFLLNELDALEDIDGFAGSADEMTMEIFNYAGAFFEGHATENKQYHDITSNLKSSTGYAVCKDGATVNDSFGGANGSNPIALKNAREGVKEILQDFRTGVVLVGIAGMEYGRYVEEMRGKAVISQSIEPTQQLIERLLEKDEDAA